MGNGQPRSEPELIDFHAHWLPKFYLERARAAGKSPDGMPSWPVWSFDQHQQLMDEWEVAISVLSVSSPGVHFGDDAAAALLARRINDEAAALASKVPGRIRFLASLPLPDVEASIREWQRVRAAPGCVGVLVLSHSAGLYPGHPSFDALWREIGKTSAIVLVHPTSPPNILALSPTRPSPMMEFYFESARACVDLFRAGVVARYPKIRFLIPHCGGALPIALDCVLAVGDRSEPGDGEVARVPNSMRDQMQALWFDAAGQPFPTQLRALLTHTTEQRIVYGSDYCFTPSLGVLMQLASINAAAPSPQGKAWSSVLTVNGKTLLHSTEI